MIFFPSKIGILKLRRLCIAATGYVRAFLDCKVMIMFLMLTLVRDFLALSNDGESFVTSPMVEIELYIHVYFTYLCGTKSYFSHICLLVSF